VRGRLLKKSPRVRKGGPSREVPGRSSHSAIRTSGGINFGFERPGAATLEAHWKRGDDEDSASNGPKGCPVGNLKRRKNSWVEKLGAHTLEKEIDEEREKRGKPQKKSAFDSSKFPERGKGIVDP